MLSVTAGGQYRTALTWWSSTCNLLSRLTLVFLFPSWVSLVHVNSSFLLPYLKNGPNHLADSQSYGGYLEHSKGSVNSCFSRPHHSAWVGCAGVWLGRFCSVCTLNGLGCSVGSSKGMVVGRLSVLILVQMEFFFLMLCLGNDLSVL